MSNIIEIDPLSCRSLRLILKAKVMRKAKVIGSATGFIVQKNNRPFLITNRHVVIERDPDELEILHHSKDKLGSWVARIETLYTNQTRRWVEHPQGHRIDIVALPLQSVDNAIQVYPFDLSLADTDMVARPAMPVSIIGYPFGLSTGGNWPVWKTGHIASDPNLDYDGLPAFLIDATTRPGMSGSPVVLRLSGNYEDRAGNLILAGHMKTRFLGVYSGRIHNDAEIGVVWRPHVITDILSTINMP